MYLPSVMLNLVPKMRFVLLVLLLISVASGNKKPEKVYDISLLFTYFDSKFTKYSTFLPTNAKNVFPTSRSRRRRGNPPSCPHAPPAPHSSAPSRGAWSERAGKSLNELPGISCSKFSENELNSRKISQIHRKCFKFSEKL